MGDPLLRIYNRLPAPMRSVAASARGLYLRSWRYSRKTDRLVEEALEREQWGAQRLSDWQHRRLAAVLHNAATRVPYYVNQWTDRRRKGDGASWEYLENWPVLEKETVRQNTAAFLADNCNPRFMFHEHTSGTSGKPLDLWWSRETVRTWYALFEARCRRWYGISRNDQWAILGGQLVTPVTQRKPPFWVWNAALRQLYMSSYHLAPNLISYYLEALKTYRVVYILGYTSSIYALADEALKLGLNIPLKVVLTNAEPIFDYQRKIIEEAFQCPVRETYGMAEIVAAASECNASRLHLWPEVGYLELFENDQPVEKGTGDLVCTGLINSDMPLIRYRIGDRASLETDTESCSCGRGLPQLGGIEGRIDDTFHTMDGRRIGRLDPIFKGGVAVREAQLIQEALNRVRVRFVPAAHYTSDTGRLIIERLRERMGNIEVILQELEHIPRESNGKFRPVICLLADKNKEFKRVTESATHRHS